MELVLAIIWVLFLILLEVYLVRIIYILLRGIIMKRTKKECVCCGQTCGTKYNNTYYMSDSAVCQNCLKRAGLGSSLVLFPTLRYYTAEDMLQRIRIWESEGETGWKGYEREHPLLPPLAPAIRLQRSHNKKTDCLICGEEAGIPDNRRYLFSDGHVCERCIVRAGGNQRYPYDHFKERPSRFLTEQTTARQETAAPPSKTAAEQPSPKAPRSAPGIPAAGSFQTFRGVKFRIPASFEYSETRNTAVLTAPQNHTVFIIAAHVIKSPSADSEPGLVHSLAVESFIGQFGDIRHREDFENGRGKALRVGANFSGRLNDGDYHCSITSLMNESTQYSVSYACRIEENKDEAYYGDYRKLLKGLLFS